MNLKFFFIIFVLTIILTRIFLWLVPRHGPMLGGIQLHHYMYGIGLILVYFLAQKPILLAIGSALVVDEIPLFFIFKTWNWPDNHWAEYHSLQSIFWVVIISVLFYFIIRFGLPPSLLNK